MHAQFIVFGIACYYRCYSGLWLGINAFCGKFPRIEPLQEIELSPWDSLTSDEISRASASVKERHGEDVVFSRISLRQPDKSEALAWKSGQVAAREAEITFRIR